LYTNKFSLT